MRPSGAALATVFAAIMPAAPVRCSTIAGEPNASLTGSTRSRAEISMPPPAGNPAMMRMVRSDCARAPPAQSVPPAPATIARRVSIVSSRFLLFERWYLGPAFADRRQERKPGVPGKIDPGVLRYLGDEGVDQRPAHRLGVDGCEMRAGQQLAHHLRGLSGVDQVVDDQHALAAALHDIARHRLDQPPGPL